MRSSGANKCARGDTPSQVARVCQLHVAHSGTVRQARQGFIEATDITDQLSLPLIDVPALPGGPVGARRDFAAGHPVCLCCRHISGVSLK